MKKLLIIASILGALGVIIGALGAHALKPHLSVQELSWIDKGVQYHFIHTIAIFICAILFKFFNSKQLIISGWLFSIGILFFSGSLYLLACRTILDITSWKWIGPITPIGGLCLIIGWILLMISMFGISNRDK